MTDKDYRVEVRVRNNWLLKAIETAGYENPNQFCLQNKIRYSDVSGYITFRQTPKTSAGEWREGFLRLAEALNCLPEDICPPQHLDKGLRKNKSSFEAGVEELAELLTGSVECSQPAIDRIIEKEDLSEINAVLSKALTPREERIIRLRFGLTPDGQEETLQAVANKYDLNRERIRQIEAKAIRKLMHPKNSRILREVARSRQVLSESHSQPVERHYVPEWKKTGD